MRRSYPRKVQSTIEQFKHYSARELRSELSDRVELITELREQRDVLLRALKGAQGGAGIGTAARTILQITLSRN